MSLDVLRGVAILLVFGNHAPYLPPEPGFLSILASLWVRIGWTGVDLFFVLSGFLVGGLLFVEIQKNNRLRVGRFFVRRAFKIWPAYMVFLAYITLGHLIKYRQEGLSYSVKALWPNYLHLQNYFGSIRIHTWSLSVEEHFYLVLPVVLLLSIHYARSSRVGLKMVPVISLLLIVLCMYLRWRVSSVEDFSYLSIQYPTHLRIDGLFFGVFLGYIYHYQPGVMAWISRVRYGLLALGILLISPFMLHEMEKSIFLQTVGFTLLYVGYGCMLLWAVSGPEKPCRRHDDSSLIRWVGCLLAFIGYYSYSIYLWHVDLGGKPVHILLRMGGFADTSPTLLWVSSMSLFIGLGCLGGIILSKVIEMPAIIVRDRLFPAHGTKPMQHAPR